MVTQHLHTFNYTDNVHSKHAIVLFRLVLFLFQVPHHYSTTRRNLCLSRPHQYTTISQGTILIYCVPSGHARRLAAPSMASCHTFTYHPTSSYPFPIHTAVVGHHTTGQNMNDQTSTADAPAIFLMHVIACSLKRQSKNYLCHYFYHASVMKIN